MAGRFGDLHALGGALLGTAALLAAMGVLHASQTALVVCVVLAGTVLGIVNTLMTQIVMERAPVARPVASAAYSFVRFTGGAIAPFLAGKLAEHVGVGVPFYVGAATTALAVVALVAYRDVLAPPKAERVEPAGPAATHEHAPMVVAVGGPTAVEVSAMAVRLARARGTAVHVLHVVEHDVVAGEAEVAAERDEEATQTLRACTEVLAQAGVTVSGELLHTHGDHADVGRAILRRAAALSAGLIVVGPATRHGALASVLGPSVTAHIAAHAPCHVLIVNPQAGAVGAGAGSVAPALWDPVR